VLKTSVGESPTLPLLSLCLEQQTWTEGSALPLEEQANIAEASEKSRWAHIFYPLALSLVEIDFFSFEDTSPSSDLCSPSSPDQTRAAAQGTRDELLHLGELRLMKGAASIQSLIVEPT
jgi:hypothetical protein